ncbi:MAG TPA: tetratricopeptide repeat protein [Spirochaetales bacterium]|nr:tetratricopeptide repeat protein [Spirochaetales bacterium]
MGVAPNDYRLSRKFQRAARICDGLGTYGIEYIEDPDSPVSEIMGRTEVVDTVRFPRKTLFIHSGDCDDTTALLASLMESAGIQTAVMTSPGHVFMAFNTEEAAENSWMYNTAGLITISYKGTLWIPVETTTLNKGFMVSWQEASKEYSTYYGKGKIEFLPVAGQQQKYPPLPLPESIFTVIEPAAVEVDRLHGISFAAIEQLLYRDLLEDLSGIAAVSKGRKAVAVKNRMGILHGRFGRYKQAENLFRECNREDPEYLSAYINLANLYLMRKEAGRAIAVLEEASAYKPDSAVLNLVLAQCYYQDLHYSRVRELYARVKEEAPALALRHSYLVAPGGSLSTSPIFSRKPYQKQ